jgi:hypothetical protein
MATITNHEALTRGISSCRLLFPPPSNQVSFSTSVLITLKPMFFLYCATPSFMPTSNNGQNQLYIFRSLCFQSANVKALDSEAQGSGITLRHYSARNFSVNEVMSVSSPYILNFTTFSKDLLAIFML